MREDTRRGTFADIVLTIPQPMAAIAYHLRALMAEVYPDVVEMPRTDEQHARYSLGPKKANEIFGYICPMQEYVRLGFYYGGGLPDPAGLLVGTGKRLRHSKIYTLDEAERPAVRQLLEAAVEERKRALHLDTSLKMA